MTEQALGVVLAGPSGVGKSTLTKRLMTEFPDKFGFSVSHTSRAPRAGEVDGVSYHFSTREQMLEEISQDKFIEFAEYAGNLYGTSKQAVENVAKTGRICILDIELQGVMKVKKTSLAPKIKFVFVKPPSFDELEKRIVGRGDTSSEAMKKRLAAAKWELETAESNPSLFDKVIINKELDVAYNELKSFLFPQKI